MPLRDLIYTVDLLKGYIEEHDYDIFGSRLIPIPTPQSIVFYNGTREEPERQILKLSDSFQSGEKKGCMEYECIVLNINYGKNQEIMEKCRTLKEYAILIAEIRKYEKEEKNIEKAVERAIDECIREEVLSDFLTKYRGEVTDMILTEYDEQKHIENEKRWSYEDGRKEGERIGREDGERIGRKEGEQTGQERMNQLNRRLIKDGRMDDLKKACEDERFQKELLKEYKFI